MEEVIYAGGERRSRVLVRRGDPGLRQHRGPAARRLPRGRDQAARRARRRERLLPQRQPRAPPRPDPPPRVDRASPSTRTRSSTSTTSRASSSARPPSAGTSSRRRPRFAASSSGARRPASGSPSSPRTCSASRTSSPRSSRGWRSCAPRPPPRARGSRGGGQARAAARQHRVGGVARGARRAPQGDRPGPVARAPAGRGARAGRRGRGRVPGVARRGPGRAGPAPGPPAHAGRARPRARGGRARAPARRGARAEPDARLAERRAAARRPTTDALGRAPGAPASAAQRARAGQGGPRGGAEAPPPPAALDPRAVQHARREADHARRAVRRRDARRSPACAPGASSWRSRSARNVEPLAAAAEQIPAAEAESPRDARPPTQPKRRARRESGACGPSSKASRPCGRRAAPGLSRLGDVITPEAGYEAALSAVLGSSGGCAGRSRRGHAIAAAAPCRDAAHRALPGGRREPASRARFSSTSACAPGYERVARRLLGHVVVGRDVTLEGVYREHGLVRAGRRPARRRSTRAARA